MLMKMKPFTMYNFCVKLYIDMSKSRILRYRIFIDTDRLTSILLTKLLLNICSVFSVRTVQTKTDQRSRIKNYNK